MPKIIGIAGGSSSGKTTIAKKLFDVNQHNNNVSNLRLDDYYKDLSHLSLEARKLNNYDHPDSIDFDLLFKHLNLLMNNQIIESPIYDFVESVRKKEKRIVEPTNVIIVEGILALYDERLRKMFDIKIYVDTPDDIRLIRRIRRDIEQRGRTIDNVVNQYLATVRPMHLQFVEPSKRYADIIVPEGGHNQVAIDIIQAKIHRMMELNYEIT